jgi:hypothetical protein
MLGVGGGVIIVPGLILVAGLPFQYAVGASLVCIVATSVSGTVVYLRRGLVDLRIGIELQIFTVLGAVAAGLVAPLVPAAPLYFGFALLTLAATVRMVPRQRRQPHGQREFSGKWRQVARGASLGAGVISGLLGVGGGILNVPILHALLGMRFDRAAATSVYIFGLTALAAAAVYGVRGDVDTMVAGTTAIGTLLGAACGAVIAGKVSGRALQVSFALLLLYVTGRMLLRGIAAL